MSANDWLRAALTVDDSASAADAAMEVGAAAREKLPESLRHGFDAICEALSLYESEQDDAARDRLQAIGMSSPFLDWKLLLRGLIAHAAGDVSRALDNWSRLNSERRAARIRGRILSCTLP